MLQKNKIIVRIFNFEALTALKTVNASDLMFCRCYDHV